MARGIYKRRKKSVCKACGEKFAQPWQVAQHVRTGECPGSTATELNPTVSVSLDSDELIQHAKTVMDRARHVVVGTDRKITFHIGEEEDIAS